MCCVNTLHGHSQTVSMRRRWKRWIACFDINVRGRVRRDQSALSTLNESGGRVITIGSASARPAATGGLGARVVSIIGHQGSRQMFHSALAERSGGPRHHVTNVQPGPSDTE